MSKKKLNQYKGALPPKKISEAINSALRNALRLVEDATILYEAERYPTAASLAILSIEESGKVSILRSLALANDNDRLKISWREYRSHTKKNVSWILPDLFSQGARKLDDFAPLFEKEAEHPYILDQLKQLGFYTDCLANKNWSIPEKVIDKELAELLIKTARIFATNKNVTEKEIELWVKHLGPVWQTNNDWMKTALENWYQEMQDLGLVPSGINKMSKFIREGMTQK